jgi:hypothetical protein
VNTESQRGQFRRRTTLAQKINFGVAGKVRLDGEKIGGFNALTPFTTSGETGFMLGRPR